MLMNRITAHDFQGFGLGCLGGLGVIGSGKPNVHQMLLDDLADGGQQRRHIMPRYPLAAARVEHRL